jgi:hypothetical protein
MVAQRAEVLVVLQKRRTKVLGIAVVMSAIALQLCIESGLGRAFLRTCMNRVVDSSQERQDGLVSIQAITLQLGFVVVQ